MGSLAALELRRKGHDVVIFEREARLLSRASACNEGKIHLGFTYGLDPTGDTARRLFSYGLEFRHDVERAIGATIADAILHDRVTYAVERDSRLAPDEAEARIVATVSAEAARHGAGEGLARRIPGDRMREHFSDRVTAAFDVGETIVNAETLCALVAAAVEADPRLSVETEVEIREVASSPRLSLIDSDGCARAGFDAVIVAAWDGMPALGCQPARADAHCLRAKTGFLVEVEEGMPPGPVTFVWGAFGDFVPHSARRAYISWYPACLMGFETAVGEGAAWFDRVSRSFDFARAFEASCAAFQRLMPGLVFAPAPERAIAGPILALAETDIADPASRLHRRDGFGLSRDGDVIFADTGKLSCAPGLARQIGAMFD